MSFVDLFGSRIPSLTPQQEFLMTGSPGILSSSIAHLFSCEERACLSKLCCPLDASTARRRRHSSSSSSLSFDSAYLSQLETSCVEFIRRIQLLIKTVNPSLLEQLGSHRVFLPSSYSSSSSCSSLGENQENEDQGIFRSRFFSILQTEVTIEQYGRVLFELIRFLLITMIQQDEQETITQEGEEEEEQAETFELSAKKFVSLLLLLLLLLLFHFFPHHLIHHHHQLTV